MLSKLTLTIFCAVMAEGAWGSSFTLNPWILIFEPEKKNVSQVVTFDFQGQSIINGKKVEGPVLDNSEISPVPVEINISAREVNLEGDVIYPTSTGSDDFVVYPSQFILYPGDSKKVQVQWVSTVLPSKEVSFGFIATQLPLKFKEPKEQPTSVVAKAKMLTRYEGVIVVRPNGITPVVVVDTAYYRNDSAGTHLVALLNNKGTGMQILRNIVLTIMPLDANGKIKFNEKVQVRDHKGSKATTQSLFAGFKRKVELPWPAGFPVVPIRATAAFPESP